MKVLVIGGTGIIGTGIVESCVKRGYDVYAISRQIKSVHDKQLPVHYVKTNWYEHGQAEDVLRDRFFDVIVDGLIVKEEQIKRDLELVKGRCKHFIFISTAGVYNQPVLMATEESPKDIEKLVWDYSVNKRLAEIYVEKHYSDYDFMITTVRPPFTYGDTRIPCAMVSRKNQWTLIDRIINEKPLVFIQDRGSCHAITHISTLSEGVVDLFMNKEANRQIYHIADDNSYSWDEVINVVGSLLGKKVKIVHIPLEELKPYNWSLYTEIKYNKLNSLSLDSTKIKMLTSNVNYSVPLRFGLNMTIEHLKKEYSNRPLDKEFSEMCDILLMHSANICLSEEERMIVNEYNDSLSKDYKKSLSYISVKLIQKNMIQRIIKAAKETVKKMIYS